MAVIDVDALEERIKNIEGYDWFEDHIVIKNIMKIIEELKNNNYNQNIDKVNNQRM